MAAEALGRYLAGADNRDQAERVWREALADLPAENDCDLLQAAVRGSLAAQLALDDEAMRLKDRLQSAGFNDPRYPLQVIL